MTIIYDGRGDVFQSRMDTITCPVNTNGAMGKGLAQIYKRRDPHLYAFYQQLCKDGILVVGRPFLYLTEDNRHNILLFPTKRHWHDSSRVEWIRDGLEYLRDKMDRAWNLRSLAMVPLGCGLGGLEYGEQVKPLIYEYLDPPAPFVEILHGGSIQSQKGEELERSVL